MTARGVGGAAARQLRVAAFSPETTFLPALARHWLDAPGAAEDGLIILPNRRAARALAGAFLTANAGKALLLPRIIALGAIDEAALTLGGLDLPPAIPPLQRQAMLAQLILKLHGKNGAPKQLHAAWKLAGDLATLLDEADYAEINLATALPHVVAAELSEHWQITLEFLQIVTASWPAILSAANMLNPAQRQIKLIDAQNAAWAARPPAHKIWLVAREANPALTRLASTIAGLPNGLLVVPGYDPTLSDAAWEALDDSHGQSGIAQLLGGIGARRAEIQQLGSPPGARTALLSRALLPAACLTDWQNPAPLDTTGLFRLQAPDEQADATAIAMILRQALETPGTSTALITPDRGLAIRVTAALKRFGITADDSAGESLAATPPAILLRLAARAAAAAFAPLPLLALLKHPLTAAGLPPERCREAARRLEVAALRGPRPPPGFAGIKYWLDHAGQPADRDFLARLEIHFGPLAGLPVQVNPATALRALITAGEAMAATAEDSGAAILWAGEAGTALSELLLEALAVLEDLPDIAAADLTALLDALLEGHVIRRPRAKDGHPRIAIWGVQEAMLQTVDVAVLGGLVEGVWPAAAEPGPWLSRPMRKAAGLPSPEQTTGLAAHDFFSLTTSCKTAVLAAPTRRERAPAVPARWITRLDAMLAGACQILPLHDAASWAAQLDTPVERLRRPKPKPCPLAPYRPRELSISEIATLMADPYAIYAKKILRIRELDALDKESDASMFGDIVHAGLAEFFSVAQNFARPDAAAQLALQLQNAMRQERPRAALAYWWEARLQRIAAWIVDAESERRADNPPVAVVLEKKGELQIPGGFILNGRADRIEKRADGSLFIVDYKTGSVPGGKQVESGSAPQLPLEAVMAEAGAFGEDFKAEVTELAFWKLSGKFEPGTTKPLFNNKPDDLRAVIAQAAASLPELFTKFADAATPYLATPHPGRSTYADVYAGISRRGEWGGDGGDDDGA
jgi:ATP-dependent helicase/nuclease subunit B